MNQAVRITVPPRDAVTNWLPVLDAAERGDVEITRADGESLLLTRQQVHARWALVAPSLPLPSRRVRIRWETGF